MALRPEFISVLRDIRDRIYPELHKAREDLDTWYPDMEQWHADGIIWHEQITEIDERIQNLSVGTVTTVPTNPDGTHGQADVRYTVSTSIFAGFVPRSVGGEEGK